jgi:hypothetical protein
MVLMDHDDTYGIDAFSKISPSDRDGPFGSIVNAPPIVDPWTSGPRSNALDEHEVASLSTLLASTKLQEGEVDLEESESDEEEVESLNTSEEEFIVEDGESEQSSDEDFIPDASEAESEGNEDISSGGAGDEPSLSIEDELDLIFADCPEAPDRASPELMEAKRK